MCQCQENFLSSHFKLDPSMLVVDAAPGHSPHPKLQEKKTNRVTKLKALAKSLVTHQRSKGPSSDTRTVATVYHEQSSSFGFDAPSEL